ncbi:MAG: 50S ribosomal protein L24 [Deltaproteobacteria bacterium]|nr:50S ribosomal protein L24 [Deltaproteobacteria bacterium]
MKRAVQPKLKSAPVKKGDLVTVISGRAKGQKGEVLGVNLTRHTVTVKEVNMRVRHTKPRRQDEKGGILSMEAPIHISNVLRFCDACGRGVRKVCEKPAECRHKERSKK